MRWCAQARKLMEGDHVHRTTRCAKMRSRSPLPPINPQGPLGIGFIGDVAEVALLFAGFASSPLTGQSIVVGHGWTMQ
jgi:hypothetical protein